MTRGQWEAMIVVACGIGVTIAAGLDIAVAVAYLMFLTKGSSCDVETVRAVPARRRYHGGDCYRAGVAGRPQRTD